jgi:hypothetical protein
VNNVLITGMVVEYDSELLAPLGVVCDKDQLADREVCYLKLISAYCTSASLYDGSDCLLLLLAVVVRYAFIVRACLCKLSKFLNATCISCY